MPSYLEQNKKLLEQSSFQSNSNNFANFVQGDSSSTNLSASASLGKTSSSQFAPASVLTTRATNEVAPLVNGIDRSVEIGETIGAKSLFRASDLEGNKIERFRFYDSGASASSGALVLNGRVQKARQWFETGLAGLNKLRYKSGLAPGSEAINIRVYDGKFWSNLGKSQVATTKINAIAPILTTTDAAVVAFESIQLKDFFSAVDPEGLPIVKYAIRDTGVRDAGGFISVNGKRKTEGKFVPVKPELLDSLRYFGRRTKNSNFETLEVRAFDGKLWSNVETIRVNTIGNAQRPVVTANALELGLNETIDATQLFSVSDADGNTIKKFRFKDTGILSDGGFLTFDGAIKKANRRFQVDASKLDLVKYTSAAGADLERIEIEAFDGKYWSVVKSAPITTLELPEVIVSDSILLVDEVEKVRVRDIISQGDTGPAPVYYEVYDANAGVSSAKFELVSQDLNAQRVYRVSASNIGNLQIQAGLSDIGREFDEFYIRANNGQDTGAWTRFGVSTETIGTRALETNNSWFGAASPQGGVITYSFALLTPLYYVDPDVEWTGRGTFSTLNAEMRAGIRSALDVWASYTGLSFEEVTDTTTDGGLTGGMMRFGSYDAGPPAYAYAGDVSGLGGNTFHGDIWFDTEVFPYLPTGAAGELDLTPGSEGYGTLMRLIGQTIGLGDPSNNADGQVFLHPNQQNQRYSVMSGNQNTDVPANVAAPVTPLIYDIMRAQQIYGAETRINSKDTTWSYEANDNLVKALWDPGGQDVLDFSNYTQSGSIDLREGMFSSVGGRADNFFMSYGTTIEDVVGGRGDEVITGNEVDNTIQGGLGRDTVTGGGGTDLLMAGAGNDKYIYRQGDGQDTINEQRLAGRDTLEIWGFDGFNKLEEDLSFRKLGRDLRIDLTIDGTPSQGTIIIKNQELGSSRIETLVLRRGNGAQIRKDLDLTAIFSKATNVPTSFKFTNFTSDFGNIASPVI